MGRRETYGLGQESERTSLALSEGGLYSQMKKILIWL